MILTIGYAIGCIVFGTGYLAFAAAIGRLLRGRHHDLTDP